MYFCSAPLERFLVIYPNSVYRTTLNFGMLPLVKIDHVTQYCFSSVGASQRIVPVFDDFRFKFSIVQQKQYSPSISSPMCDRFPQKFDVQTSHKPLNYVLGLIFVVNIKFPQATHHKIVPSTEELYCLKGHSHAILILFKNQKYVLTSMNAHK